MTTEEFQAALFEKLVADGVPQKDAERLKVGGRIRPDGAAAWAIDPRVPELASSKSEDLLVIATVQVQRHLAFGAPAPRAAVADANPLHSHRGRRGVNPLLPGKE